MVEARRDQKCIWKPDQKALGALQRVWSKSQRIIGHDKEEQGWLSFRTKDNYYSEGSEMLCIKQIH